MSVFRQVTKTPYERLGGEEVVRALAERFYDVMEETEPELTAIHRQDEPGKVSRESRERFALFLIGWLGGRQEYMERFGHPRLRMRHAGVEIGTDMRDAWMRSMRKAMESLACDDEVRAFLDERFAHVADFLRNVPGD